MKDQTMRNLINGGVGLICAAVGFLLGTIIWNNHPRSTMAEPETTADTTVQQQEPSLDDHIAMIVPEKLQDVCKALVWVESKGNASAISPDGNYVGILQLGKIYVKECNRIQDKITFTPEDRTDIVKSLQMFTIYQTHKNREHDIHEAIRLHNPTAGPEYKAKVLQRFETIY